METLKKKNVYNDFSSERKLFMNKIRKLLELINANRLRFVESDRHYESDKDYQEVVQLMDYAIFVGSVTYDDMQRINDLWRKHKDIQVEQSGSCYSV